MILYLLDTNVLSDFIKGIHPGLNKRMGDAIRLGEISMSVITRAEIRYGQCLMEAGDRRRKRIDLLLEEVPALPWKPDAADRYGSIKAQLRRQGVPIGEMDTQIAAHAVVENLCLVTHNTRHFSRIAGLRLEDWTS